jgi:diguanylate cyclase (GGDEF)-like protein
LKIEEVRSSFTVYIIASELNRLDGISESLGLAGYMCASFTELTAAFSEFNSNPPHMVLLDGEEESFDLGKTVRQIVAQLPESHIFIVSPLELRERNLPFLDKGAYDLIYTPVKSTTELLKKLDRAAERDYFMYLNERLVKDGDTGAANGAAAGSGAVNTDYVRQLFEQRSSDDCIQVYLNSLGALLGCGAVFFKFISNRRVLMATQAYNLEFDWNGLGVNFNDSGSDSFRAIHLREPSNIPEFRNMVIEAFHSPEFFATPVDALGEIQGVVAFLRPLPSGAQYQTIEDFSMMLGKALSLQEAERRLHVITIKDPATELLNRQNFIQRVAQEISRSRRTMTPVSLVTLVIDQFGVIMSQMGTEEAQTVLRMAARIFEKHSRVNDIIGRTGSDEFGILLPHTGRAGAMIKAERLRRIIESADFSRVLKAFPNLTVSIGIAEYPSMVRDADELLHAADEALYQVRSQGNKTCVAKPPEGFVADFQVKDKGL